MKRIIDLGSCKIQKGIQDSVVHLNQERNRQKVSSIQMGVKSNDVMKNSCNR